MLKWMGYTSVWSRYRDQFPVTQNLIYMNHAGVTPLCKAAADAMRWVLEDNFHYGSDHYDKWMACYEGLRNATAKLINADAAEIALVKNTSEGISMVAQGIDWVPGDKVIAFDEEFPANYYPWQRLESKGVTVKFLSVHDSLETIEQECRGARLLTISYVQYLSGLRINLKALGDICARQKCFFFVDAIQGMGVFPIDVRDSKIHALAADGHKWLLGPEGCGVLYVQRDRQDEIAPVEFGYTNVQNCSDYGQRTKLLRTDAARYECGTMNTIGCFGLRAAIEFILEVGVSQIGPAVQALGDQLADGARRKGYEVFGERTPETGSGIVSFRKEGVDSRMLYKHLKDAGVIGAPRAGWMRLSPHFYISPEDVDKAVSLMP
jgi:cysteine desulfurase/selenocysteine lyase